MIQISISYFYIKDFICKFYQNTSDFVNSPRKTTEKKVFNSKESETSKPEEEKESRNKTVDKISSRR